MDKTFTLDELQKQLNTLPLPQVLHLLDEYHKETGTDVTKYKRDAVVTDWEIRLSALGINTTCPECGNHQISKFGNNGHTKRFQCKKCKKTFSLFMGTILEKTKYDWHTWVKVMHLILKHSTIQSITNELVENDELRDLDYKTVYIWYHKILHAIAQIPMPKLTGVIQIDETYFRESQKGSRNLKSYIKGETRWSTFDKPKASYGITGNEFSNVVCLIDSTGHCVAKVVGLGNVTCETFEKEFDEYIVEPKFICSDANPIYKRYCEDRHIPLYVMPSTYKKRLKKEGYISTRDMSPDEAEKTKAKNQKIFEKLYKDNEIDYIEGLGNNFSYKKFKKIKKANGLSLARVNNLHRTLKDNIEKYKRNVSTKFLPDYVALEIFLRNWKVEHGDFPTGIEEAEEILLSILKPEHRYFKKDIYERKMDLPRKSDRGMALLKEKTLKARRALHDDEFEFDEDDGITNFNKRDALWSFNKTEFETLRRKYKITPKWVKDCIVAALAKEETIEDDIIRIIAERKDKKRKKREKRKHKYPEHEFEDEIIEE